MEHFADKLTEKLILHQIIKYEDKELYSYGIWQGILLLFNILTAMVISSLFGMLWQGVVFTVTYAFLRTHAGGYHSRTATRCYFFSILLLSGALSLIKFISWNNMGIMITLLLSGTVILALAPVEDENKKLDETEQAVFKKRTKSVFFILTILVLIANRIGLAAISICITVSICTSAFMLILGEIKNRAIKKG
ncbi:MAG: accessory gene regulator B family protein [Lacrimispora sp.]|uniref:accessory gene regulator ArgB-like protein n=1 Tax=Lacrimispora sp. TaxID=2719234 RepID=UPI0039E32EF7